MIVITALLLTALLGMAALAIDAGGFRQAETQAQSAADAGALAAADDLPNNPTQAAADATTYATTNDPGATVSVTTPYQGNPAEAQISVTNMASSGFGRVLGVQSAKVSATAIAQTTLQTTCANPGSGCYSVFAMDNSSCGSWFFPHYALSFTGLGINLSGYVHSNGSAYAGLISFSSFGDATYSDASGCSWVNGLFDSYNSGPTAEDPVLTWPVDYSQDFPACGATGDPCSGPDGTPSFCTQASTSTYWVTSPSQGNIYCGIGSGTPSTPSTWTGTLIIGAGLVGWGGHPMQASYVAGTVSLGAAGDVLEACGFSTTGFQASGCTAGAPVLSNYPLIYAVSGDIDTGSFASTLTGDLFAPNATINYFGALSSVGFLEADDVNYAGILSGDGPSSSGVVTRVTSLIG